MAKSLIIVESPAKARTIGRIVGSGYHVLASNGHVRDLPKSKLGVEVDSDFEPQYVTIRAKSKIIKQLREKAKEADQILLAPDPDREGEAIAWHLTKVLDGKKHRFERLVFHEITRRAVKEALKSPRQIDMDKVNAQQARRVLDRLVGYQLSPVLWKTIRYGLSAGRVQSVALRLIVDREREVERFVRVEYWTIHALVEAAGGHTVRMGLVSWEGKKPSIGNEAEAQGILDQLKGQPFEVSAVKTRRRKRNPRPPFITSTMQQDAFRKLRFSSKKTMKVAQQLYEGLPVEDERSVGLITYMRTDSTRIADEALADVRGHVEKELGAEYLPENPNVYRKKGRAQDAHEAIRPTSVSRTPESVARFLGADQLKLYTLIWKRFVASQMRPQEIDVTVVDAACGGAIFRASGRRVVFDGFTRLYEESGGNGSARDESGAKGRAKDADEQGISESDLTVETLPELKEGDRLTARELDKKQHFTEPPPRYTEATLIRTLEEKGIGRPSTYATIVSTILTRDYVRRDKSRLLPTELGCTVVDLLVRHFTTIMNVDFTAHMEGELDRIEEGEDAWVDVVREFYQPFRKSLDEVESKVQDLKASVQVATGEVCEECGAPMVRKFGRNGPFLACSKYPDCKSTQPLNEDEKPQETDHKCPSCGSPMLIRTGRFGRFLACSQYPKCKTTQAVPVGVACPEEDCKGQLVEKRTRGGRVFYGCDQYPKCKHALWDRPVLQPCAECGHPFVTARQNKKLGAHYFCPHCKAVIPQDQEESVHEGTA
jgi:DNA topoisomerase-1